jgi:hypothetical protein
MLNLIRELIFCLANPTKLINGKRDFLRLQNTRNSRAQEQKHDVWITVHSEETLKHNRYVKDAAMNRWFVCNKGNSKQNCSLVYNPYRSIAEEVGKNRSLSAFSAMWEKEPLKNQKGDAITDFWSRFAQSGQFGSRPGFIETMQTRASGEADNVQWVVQESGDAVANFVCEEGWAAQTLSGVDAPVILPAMTSQQSTELPTSFFTETGESDDADNPSSWLLFLAQDNKTSARVLHQLSFHPHTNIREAVAANSSSPDVALRRLAQDPHPRVRYLVADNDNSSVDLLKKLLLDDNQYVAFKAHKALNARGEFTRPVVLEAKRKSNMSIAS